MTHRLTFRRRSLSSSPFVSAVVRVCLLASLAAGPVTLAMQPTNAADDTAAVAARLDAAVAAGELDAWKATLLVDLLDRLGDPTQRYLEVADHLDREVDAGRTTRAEALRELIELRRTLWGAETTPRPIHRPAPDLDLDTRKLGPAEVVVRILVGPDGRVKNAVVARSSNDAFETPTLDAVRRWRFAPAVEDGLFTTARLQVPIRFPAPEA